MALNTFVTGMQLYNISTDNYNKIYEFLVRNTINYEFKIFCDLSMQIIIAFLYRYKL